MLKRLRTFFVGHAVSITLRPIRTIELHDAAVQREQRKKTAIFYSVLILAVAFLVVSERLTLRENERTEHDPIWWTG